jgi:hypothetical protein
MWTSTTMSNGIVVHLQQNLRVISLIDVEVEWRRGSLMKIRKGDQCLVRQEPYPDDDTSLSLGKATGAWNFRTLKTGVREGTDFKVIDGEVPYPPLRTEAEAKADAASFIGFMDLLAGK